ncbi:MAG: type II toxin-antitoxin system MqsA family antitoxin [Polaromonas sp.]|nr:type II toxin-antitoxin system MqsA family antitoxin [Polaromonas sp.]
METRTTKLRTCPCCGAAGLVADCRTITAIVNSQQITVPNVHSDFCPECGVGVLDRENADRYGAALALARKNSNG